MRSKRIAFLSIAFLILFLIAFSLFGCAQADPGKQENFETSAMEKTILDEELIQASYLGISEEFGHTVLHLEFINKTDQKISILPADTHVDGNVLIFTSESMAVIEPGASFQQAWMMGSRPKDEVEFKIAVYDAELKELFVSDFIKIEVKQ